MSDWITDRRPTEEDCKDKEIHQHVWVMYYGKVVSCPYGHVVKGCPWRPILIDKPEPYAKEEQP